MLSRVLSDNFISCLL